MRRARRWAIELVILALLAAALLIVHPWAHRHAHAAQIAETYTFTSHAFMQVPKSATRLDFVVAGAAGKPGNAVGANHGGSGGRGSVVSFSVTVGPYSIRPTDNLRIKTPRADEPYAYQRDNQGGAGGQGAKNAGAGGMGGSLTSVEDIHHVRGTVAILAIAGGGGGGGGAGALSAGGAGGDGGRAGNGAALIGNGGAAPHPCVTPDPDHLEGDVGVSTIEGYGAGGGGGGGCSGGPGGLAGDFASGGGGGAGGANYWFPYAHNASVGTETGDGYVRVTVHTYTEPPPVITSPDVTMLEVGHPVRFDVIAKGAPPPDLTVSGKLPLGVTFRVVPFEGRAELRGTPEPGTAGNYDLTVSARNDFGSVTQKLFLTVANRS